MRYSVKVHTFPRSQNRDTDCDCITNDCGSGTNMKKVKRPKAKGDSLVRLGLGFLGADAEKNEWIWPKRYTR